MKISMKENVIAFGIALVLAFWVVAIINNSDMLMADITWLEQQQSQRTQWDVLYYFSGQDLILDSQKNIDRISTLTIMMDYNPQEVDFDMKDFDSDFDFTASINNEEWTSSITLEGIDSISSDQNIANISIGKVAGSDIVLSDVSVGFTDWTVESLSISKN